MVRRVPMGWLLAAFAALLIGVTTLQTASASGKEKVVHYSGVVKAVTPTSITLSERHILSHHDVTHALSASPTVSLTSGTGTDVPVGAEVPARSV